MRLFGKRKLKAPEKSYCGYCKHSQEREGVLFCFAPGVTTADFFLPSNTSTTHCKDRNRLNDCPEYLVQPGVNWGYP